MAGQAQIVVARKRDQLPAAALDDRAVVPPRGHERAPQVPAFERGQLGLREVVEGGHARFQFQRFGSMSRVVMCREGPVGRNKRSALRRSRAKGGRRLHREAAQCATLIAPYYRQERKEVDFTSPGGVACGGG